MADKRLRDGVLGLRRGMVFANVLASHPDARPAALCNHNSERLQQAAEGFREESPQPFGNFGGYSLARTRMRW